MNFYNKILFNSDKFIGLKAPIIELFLKRDDLCLDEIIIWDSLIKWSLAQNPTISQDVTKWNKEEFTIMERTLNRFIPLIRFYHITPENFLDKVYPFKKLLPKGLVKNILAFHMTPNRELNFDILPPRQQKYSVVSDIIESQHFALFSNWIDRKDNLQINSRNIPYNFSLLYRASGNEMNVTNFHNKCDNKGATLFVAKIQGTNQNVHCD